MHTAAFIILLKYPVIQAKSLKNYYKKLIKNGLNKVSHRKLSIDMKRLCIIMSSDGQQTIRTGCRNPEPPFPVGCTQYP
jgi:hypothetical protein